MAEREVYRLNINVDLDGDEKAKKKLSAVEKYAEKSEKRMNQLDKVQASPAVRLEDKLTGPMDKIEKGIGGFAKRAVGKFAAIATAGAVLVGGLGIKSTMSTFVDFEQGLANVQAVSKASSDEMKRLSDTARQLGKDTEWSAVEVTQAEELLAQAGFTVQENIDALPGLLSLASAGGLELADATDIAAGTLKAFGMEAGETSTVADVLSVAASKTNSGVYDLGEAMKYVGPVAKGLNIGIEDTTAALGMLHDANIKGGQAGTVLRGSLIKLAKPSKQASELMEELGFNAFDSNGQMLGLEEIIGGLQKSTAGLTEEQRANAMATLFGQQNMAGMLALVEQGPDRFKELSTSMKESSGAAEEMADARLDSISGQMKLLQSATDEMKLSLGEKLAPYTRQFVEWLTGKMPDITNKVVLLAEKIQEFATKAQPKVKKLIEILQKMSPVIVGIAASLATLKVASIIGKGIDKVRGFSTGLLEMKTAFSVVSGGAGGLKAAMGALMGPVGWIAIGIGALVGGFVLAYNHSELFREKVNELKEAFISFAQPIIEAILPTLQTLGESFMGLISNIFPLVSSAVELLMGVLTVLWQTVLQPIAQFLLETFGNAFTTAFTIIGSVVSNVVTTISGILEGLSLLLSGISDFIVGVFTGNWEQAWEGIKSITSGAIEGIKSLFTGLTDALKEVPGQMLSIGKDIVRGLANGIKAMASVPVNAIKNVGKSIVGGVKSVLRIKSPSRVMMEVGEFTTEGLAVGMDNEVPVLEKSANRTVDIIEENQVKQYSERKSPLEKVVEKVSGYNPMNVFNDNKESQPQFALATAGGGGGSTTIINIDGTNIEISEKNENGEDKTDKEIVEEAMSEFGKAILDALKGRK